MVNGDELKQWRTGERSVSERFSDYVVNTDYSDLNDEAIRETKTLLLDVFATAIVGVKGSGGEDDQRRFHEVPPRVPGTPAFPVPTGRCNPLRGEHPGLLSRC